MTREQAKEVFLNRGYISINGGTIYDPEQWRESCRVISEWLEQEPLTDKEQRIFLAAMRSEEKFCRKVCTDGYGIDFVSVCHEVERKVKKALWE